ncbi:MAG: 2-oxoglutarate dehydrogenase, E2 component, dihydrolipoamide succinyltransferase [Actinobacteria bacterium]|nr:2-oxoglutarate dehydrogenase, E2 component, dihydrolipoamide succinyltransferase [Actinomycetota bacterium]
MSFSVRMPALGESVTEGTVTRWLKNEGDAVALDEPLLEVSTDKVDTEIPSPAAGTLSKIIVTVDQTVAVGAELALIDSANATPATSPAATTPAASAPAPASTPASTPAPAVAATPPTTTSSPATTPAPASASVAGATVVSMPALGESVTEGTVTRWLKSVGDSVAVDEPLLEVSTDKVDTEIPSPVAGTLISIDVAVDQTVPVGARLASIGSSSAVSAPAAAVPTTPVVAKPAPAAIPSVTPSVTPSAAPMPTPVVTAAAPALAPATRLGDAYVTPIVRKLAAELGVDLSSVRGSGVGGRIRKEDVVAAVPSRATMAATPSLQNQASAVAPAAAVAPVTPSPLRGTRVPMSRLRKVIAARMVESLQVSAQLTTVVEVDVTAIDRLRNKAKASFEAREGVKIYHGAEHLGIAVDTDRGLLVPVIRDAGDLNMGGIARKIADVASRTRDNKISPDELGGGTFTITNTGSRGALFDTPIINQPQVAILGLGSVVKRPMVVKGADGGETIAIRSMVYLALSYDHRIVDGADAARFLTTLKERLEGGRFESDLGL